MQDDKKKILLFGGSGMVGSRFVELMQNRFDIIAPKREEVDVYNFSMLKKCIQAVHPDFILYSVGLTRVDQAEKEKKIAYRLNTYAAEHVADLANSISIPLYYLSTDAVFHGTQKERPYKESNLTHPVSVYGKSKAQGEKVVLRQSNKNCVIRLISVFSAVFPRKTDFIRMTIDALSNNRPFAGIQDQILNPLFVDYAAEALSLLMKEHASGIFHLGATNSFSNYEFAVAIARIFSLDEQLIYPILHDDFFKGKAPRGKYCSLDVSKFENTFGGILHTIEESLSDF